MIAGVGAAPGPAFEWATRAAAGARGAPTFMIALSISNAGPLIGSSRAGSLEPS